MARSLAFLGFIAVGLCGTACSGSSTAANRAQWQPVVQADLAGTPDLADRDRETLNLSAAGDFNGDGRTDKAAIKKDQAANRYGVLVCLEQASGTCRDMLLTSGPIAHLSTLGIKTLPAASADEALAKVKGKMSSARQLGKQDILEVFAFEASSSVFSWTGKGFEEVQVTD